MHVENHKIKFIHNVCELRKCPASWRLPFTFAFQWWLVFCGLKDLCNAVGTYSCYDYLSFGGLFDGLSYLLLTMVLLSHLPEKDTWGMRTRWRCEETNRRLVDYPGMHEMKIYWPQYLPHRVEALSKHLLVGIHNEYFFLAGVPKVIFPRFCLF